MPGAGHPAIWIGQAWTCIVRAMTDRDQDEARCPRCGYDLRGLPRPQCPECGLEFDAADWPTGVLRENVPGALDRCDPWQPHAVAWGGLLELVRGARSPRRHLVQLDIRGPLRAAGLAFVAGSFWLYVITVGLCALALWLHGQMNPHGCVTVAALYLGPRVLLVGLVAAGLVFGVVAVPEVMRVPRPGWRQYLRIAGHWVPSAATYSVVAWAGLQVIEPELVLGVPYVCPLLTGFPAIAAVVGRARGIRVPTPGATWVRIWASLLAWVLAATWLAIRMLPRTLEPPLGWFMP